MTIHEKLDILLENTGAMAPEVKEVTVSKSFSIPKSSTSSQALTFTGLTTVYGIRSIPSISDGDLRVNGFSFPGGNVVTITMQNNHSGGAYNIGGNWTAIGI